MTRTFRIVTPQHKRVLGIDASLTSTGYAFRIDGAVVTGAINAGKGVVGPTRLAYVASAVANIIVECRPDLIVLEDYAMGRGAAGRAFSIGELGGVLKTLFWENQIDVMLVSPTALKKAITGKGNADKAQLVDGKKVKDKNKPEMRAALLNTFKLDLSQNDEADACGLMLMGEMRFGSNTVAKATQNTLRLDALKECSIIRGRTNV